MDKPETLNTGLFISLEGEAKNTCGNWHRGYHVNIIVVLVNWCVQVSFKGAAFSD